MSFICSFRNKNEAVFKGISINRTLSHQETSDGMEEEAGTSVYRCVSDEGAINGKEEIATSPTSPKIIQDLLQRSRQKRI